MRQLWDRVFGTLTGRWLVLIMALVALNGAMLWAAQDAAAAAGSPSPTMSVPELSTMTGIVALTVPICWFLKARLAETPYFSEVPVWIYAASTSLILTFLANRVLHTLEGDFWLLAWQGMMSAGSASGFREWVYSGVKKPLSASGTGTSGKP